MSIQALTYVESLISQAAEAVVQALANQQAISAYLDEKLAELKKLRQAYADLLR